MLGEKSWWELFMDAACYLEQIPEAEPYKTAAMWVFTLDLSNYPSKVIKTCWLSTVGVVETDI